MIGGTGSTTPLLQQEQRKQTQEETKQKETNEMHNGKYQNISINWYVMKKTNFVCFLRTTKDIK